MNDKIEQVLEYENWGHNRGEMLKKYNWENSAKEFLNAINFLE
jgi:hypothetical protein